MAARKNAKRNNNGKNGENTMTEAVVETVPENVSETSETVSETEDKFELPDSPEKLDLGNPVATMIGQRFLAIYANVQEINAKLHAAQTGDSTPAIIAFAESDAASPNIKAILAEYNALKAQLDSALAQLSAEVKAAKGEVALTPEQIEELKAQRKSCLEQCKTAIKFFAEFMTDNKTMVTEEITKFLNTITGLVGRAPRTTSGTTSSGTYNATTTIRPRLSNRGNNDGYIEVKGQRFNSFTGAIKAAPGLVGRPVTAGELHNAWAEAGNFELENWQTAPRGLTEFSIKDKDGNDVPVAINFQYTGK